MATPFRMRHFVLEQGNCAMRLSTDALFLGAWATHSVVQDPPSYILDVGTGTGILSLMLAQRYPGAKICAIDIESEAVHTAQYNFANSPWADRLSAIQCDITAREITLQKHRYGLIISNPPYYDGLKPSSTTLSQARNTVDGFAPHHLFSYLEPIVSDVPTLCLITPIETLPSLRREAVLHRYTLSRICYLYHSSSHPAIRILTQWCRSEVTSPSCHVERLIIRDEQQLYTAKARDLLHPYLLDQYLGSNF